MRLLPVLGLHALLALSALAFGRRLGRGVLALVALAPLAALVYLAAVGPAVLAGTPASSSLPWAPSLGLTVDLRLDAFAGVMVVLVAGIGLLVLGYCVSYFHPRPDLPKFAATFVAFGGAMLGLVLADDLYLLYIFWELTSITSFLLIGFDDRREAARAAARQALLVTTVGGLAMLAGFVLLAQAAGSSSLSGLLADPPSGTAVTVGVLLALAGAVTKSAQVPFHTWLPAAMAAPTPVSAYLHSATMVKAGIYLVARLAPAFAPTVGPFRPLVVGLGVATMLVGGYRALRQTDLKRLLAFGTVSQLGFLFAALGSGSPELATAGTALLLAHGLFKAALFLVVGIVDHQAHTRDLTRLTGLWRRLPGTAAVALAACVSMAGLPPLFGFVAKEAVFEGFLHGGLGPVGPLGLVGVIAGSVLTVAYTLRFLWGAFADKPCQDPAEVAPEPGPFVLPAALLALASLVGGVLPATVSPLVVAGGRALDPAAPSEELALWHGLGPALGLSALTATLGLALFLGRRPITALQARVPVLPGGDELYRGSVQGMLRVAGRTTAIVQNGSLPVYLGVILLTAVAVPGVLVAGLGGLPAPAVVADSPLQVLAAAGVAVAALGAATVGRRFAAVLLVGAVGYGVAVLFVLQGAPDLALTQVLIETVTVVVFVLVLRRLPERFRQARWPLGNALRVVVSVSVGVAVTVLALAVSTGREGSSVAGYYLREAYEQAEGRNVVNTILVDFRAFDTLGEITVLAVATVGALTLVGGLRRRRPKD